MNLEEFSSVGQLREVSWMDFPSGLSWFSDFGQWKVYDYMDLCCFLSKEKLLTREEELGNLPEEVKASPSRNGPPQV